VQFNFKQYHFLAVLHIGDKYLGEIGPLNLYFCSVNFSLSWPAFLCIFHSCAGPSNVHWWKILGVSVDIEKASLLMLYVPPPL